MLLTQKQIIFLQTRSYTVSYTHLDVYKRQIKDLAEGKYHLPWEDDMDIKDGTIYGYPTTGGRFGTEPSPDPYGIDVYKRQQITMPHPPYIQEIPHPPRFLNLH